MRRFDRNVADQPIAKKKGGDVIGEEKFFRSIAKQAIIKRKINQTTLNYIDKALERIQTVEGYDLRSLALNELMDFPQSIKDAQTSLKIGSPYNVKALQTLASSLFYSGEPVEALVNYYKAHRLRIHEMDYLAGIFACEDAITSLKLQLINTETGALDPDVLNEFYDQTAISDRDAQNQELIISKMCRRVTEDNSDRPSKASLALNHKWGRDHDLLHLLIGPRELENHYQFLENIFRTETMRLEMFKKYKSRNEPSQQEKVALILMKLSQKAGSVLNQAAKSHFKLGK